MVLFFVHGGRDQDHPPSPEPPLNDGGMFVGVIETDKDTRGAVSRHLRWGGCHLRWGRYP